MEVVAETIAVPAPPAAQPSSSSEEQLVAPVVVQKSASVDLPKPKEAVQNEVILL